MKLLELLGVKKFHGLTIEELIELFVEKTGKKSLGGGIAGYVFEYGPNEVIKFWFHDPAYEKFLKYIEAHPHGKHLPKLKSKIKTITAFHHRPKITPVKIKYIKLEKLQKVSAYETKEIIAKIDKVLDKNITREKLIIDPEQESFINSVLDVYEALIEDNLYADLHDENIMKRSDGTLVLSDPLSSFDNISFNDLLKTQQQDLSLKAREKEVNPVKGPSYSKFKEKE